MESVIFVHRLYTYVDTYEYIRIHPHAPLVPLSCKYEILHGRLNRGCGDTSADRNFKETCFRITVGAKCRNRSWQKEMGEPDGPTDSVAQTSYPGVSIFD